MKTRKKERSWSGSLVYVTCSQPGVTYAPPLYFAL